MKWWSDDAEFPTRVRETRERQVDVGLGQRRRHLGADAGPALGHDRKEEARHEHAAPVERGREVLGAARVVQHHRDDGRGAIERLEARALEPVAEPARERHEMGTAVVGGAGDLDGLREPAATAGARLFENR